MQKISKKIILIKSLKTIDIKYNSNFYLVSVNNLNEINKECFSIYKKGLYRYILPGKFLYSLKSYFKNHTYINYTLNKSLMLNLINRKEIIVYKYNNFVFLNNSVILRHINKDINFEFFKGLTRCPRLFLICLIFFIL